MINKRTESFLITRGSIFAVSGVLGFIANIIQVVFICQDKKQTRSVFGITLLSLSISDLFVSIVLLYRGIIRFLTLFLVIELSRYSIFGNPTNLAIIFSFSSSFFHVVYIAVLRAVAVVHPLKIKQIFTQLRCKIIIALLWVLSISLAFIAYFITGPSLVAYLAMITSCLLIFLYSFICYTKYSRNHIQNNEQMQRHGQDSDKDVLIYSITLTFIFCLCTLPEALSFFIRYPPLPNYISAFLYSINPFLDTMLYFFTSYCKRRRERNNLRNNIELHASHSSTQAKSCETIMEETCLWKYSNVNLHGFTGD